MSQPPAAKKPAAVPSESLRGALDSATTRVPTRALVGRGVEQIRLLSESRFVEIVRDLVEASISRRAADELAAAGDAAGDLDADGRSPAEDAELRQELEENWRLLREKHRGHLETLEGRLEQLGGTFDAIRGALARLEDRTAAGTGQHPMRPPVHRLRRELESQVLGARPA